jgi:hypothetical protein
VAIRTPVSLPVAASLPPLSDAFAALLATEGEGAQTAVLSWPATAPVPPTPVATDDLIDDITRRVLERLSDQTVRDTVSEMVSRIAEQLVREEIERIKASIKQ